VDTSDIAYEKRHRKYESFEKRQRLREKEKLKHEHYKLKERIEQLRNMEVSAFLALPASSFSAPPAHYDELSEDITSVVVYPTSINAIQEGERRRKEMLEIAEGLEERYRVLLPSDRGRLAEKRNGPTRVLSAPTTPVVDQSPTSMLERIDKKQALDFLRGQEAAKRDHIVGVSKVDQHSEKKWKQQEEEMVIHARKSPKKQRLQNSKKYSPPDTAADAVASLAATVEGSQDSQSGRVKRRLSEAVDAEAAGSASTGLNDAPEPAEDGESEYEPEDEPSQSTVRKTNGIHKLTIKVPARESSSSQPTTPAPTTSITTRKRTQSTVTAVERPPYLLPPRRNMTNHPRVLEVMAGRAIRGPNGRFLSVVERAALDNKDPEITPEASEQSISAPQPRKRRRPDHDSASEAPVGSISAGVEDFAPTVIRSRSSVARETGPGCLVLAAMRKSAAAKERQTGRNAFGARIPHRVDDYHDFAIPDWVVNPVEEEDELDPDLDSVSMDVDDSPHSHLTEVVKLPFRPSFDDPWQTEELKEREIKDEVPVLTTKSEGGPESRDIDLPPEAASANVVHDIMSGVNIKTTIGIVLDLNATDVDQEAPLSTAAS
jgi:hypothetical protein